MFTLHYNSPLAHTTRLVLLCLTFMLGLIGARHVLLTSLAWLMVLGVWWFWLRPRHSLLAFLILLVACFAVGLIRGAEYVHKMQAYNAVADQKVAIVGVAKTDAVYGKRYQLTFDMSQVEVASPVRSTLFGTLTISGFGESMIYKGDTVVVTGKLRRTLGNNVAAISYGQLTVVAHHTSPIDDLRRRFNAGIQSALPEPAASFGLGLLVGQRNTLPEHISTQLMMVGLTHIIAVSGYNLTIILRAAGKLMGKRSKYQYLLFSILLICLFLLFAGTSPSIVRASVVCGLGLAAWYYGRTVVPLVLLLFSAAITAYMNPLYVWGSVSWYLSFLAFFGVLVVSPLVTKRIYGEREPGLVQAVVLESICAEVMTLPYVLLIFGQMSTVGILANVLVVALIPLAMLLTLFAGLAGMLLPTLAGWIAWPAKLLLTYMLDIASLLSKIPHAFLEHIGFSVPCLIIAYGSVFFTMIVLWRRGQKYAIITDKIDPNDTSFG